MSARKLAHISLVVVAACIAGCLAATASAATPTFVTTSIDDTQSFAHTSEVCGFPVLEHDVGTVTTMFTTLPDGSVRAHDIVVKITATFYSTDPNHAGTARRTVSYGSACGDKPMATAVASAATTIELR